MNTTLFVAGAASDPVTRRCVTCRAFLVDDGDEMGSCQLHPPIPIGNVFMFPGVHPLAWCLDWQRKENQEAQP